MLQPRLHPPTAHQRGPWTYDRYCALPDDGKRYEIVWGELYVVPSPNAPHQTAALRLASLLDRFVQEHGLGKVYIAPFDVVLSRDTVVQPDVLFISRERAAIRTRANVQGSPDLVVEVLSPGTAARDLGIKRDVYALHGVPHYWLIDPDSRSLEAYELREADDVLVQHCAGDEVFAPARFPGLAIPLAALWSE
ncbi:MAG: Uma2 family endonuclease [Chloroflexi bacterium]|nr:Uma2 family endonuclease [Chloroflexota bacterium]